VLGSASGVPTGLVSTSDGDYSDRVHLNGPREAALLAV
jgi:hypothetical protein